MGSFIIKLGLMAVRMTGTSHHIKKTGSNRVKQCKRSDFSHVKRKVYSSSDYGLLTTIFLVLIEKYYCS